MRQPNRREALKHIGAAGAGLLVAPIVITGQGDGYVVAGQPVELAFEIVNPQTTRLTIRPVGKPATGLADGALSRDAWKAGVAPFAAPARANAAVVVGAGNVRATVRPLGPGPLQNVAVVFTTAPAGGRGTSSPPFQRLEFDRATGRVTFEIGDGAVLGLGQGGPQFNRRGASMPNRSGAGAFNLRTHGGRVPVQWMITNRGAIYIHQPLGTIDLTGETGAFEPPANTPLPMDIFVVGSTDPAVIMRSWADITGYPEMPPLWSFGYHQSHRTLSGFDDMIAVAKTFREKKLPCDSLIYLGTEFAPSGWNTRNGEFTFHPENFPNPKSNIDALHALNFKVSLHVVVESRRVVGKVSDPCTAPPIPPGRTAEGQWPSDRQVSCYWPAHKPLFDVGVDGWWPDQGDGLDAPSRLARNLMYWAGSQMYRPNERVFALNRNGYAGMQRGASFLWSGDVFSLWETLKNHVPIAVNTSLSGIPYWGTDIGGFVPTADYTGELHVRWFQFGTFNTLFRSHGRLWRLRLPWGWNTGNIGIDEMNYATVGAQRPPDSELRNAEIEPIVRKYLELRYRLLPYTYTAVRECRDTGMPVLRAMWLHHADDPRAAALGDQYLWGRDILVAPVVEKAATRRRVYLPKGTWFDLWTNERLTGAQDITRDVDLATMPIYVRGGSVIPFAPVRQYADEPVTTPTELIVYPGADATASIYEDDGRTLEYQKSPGMRIVMRWRDTQRTLELSLAPGSTMRAPLKRSFSIRMAGSTEGRIQDFEGRTVIVRV